MRTATIISAGIIVLAATVFNVWLASGCALGSGYVTLHGKECVWPQK